MKSSVLVVSVIILFAASAAALDSPNLKPGLWETQVETGKKTKQCVDSTTTEALFNPRAGKIGRSCEKSEMEKKDGKFVSTVICKGKPSTMTQSKVVEGDFNKRYTITVTSKYDPPIPGKEDSVSKITASWLGACRRGYEGRRYTNG